MTIQTLINDVVAKGIELYMKHDYDYVLSTKRKGGKTTALNVEEEVAFIKRNGLAHEALSDKAIEKAAIKLIEKMQAIEDSIDRMIAVECTLDRQLSEIGHKLLEEDWKAFYDEPSKYAGTIVIDMVLEYLHEYDK